MSFSWIQFWQPCLFIHFPPPSPIQSIPVSDNHIASSHVGLCTVRLSSSYIFLDNTIPVSWIYQNVIHLAISEWTCFPSLLCTLEASIFPSYDLVHSLPKCFCLLFVTVTYNSISHGGSFALAVMCLLFFYSLFVLSRLNPIPFCMS